MKPETTGADLLQAVDETLSREIAPQLSGEARFKTLMAASAVRMVIREIALAGELRASAEALARGAPLSDLPGLIRSGAFDADAEFHARLLEHARIRSALVRPPEAKGP